MSLYEHTGEDVSNLGSNFQNLELKKAAKIENEKERRKSNLFRELIKMEKEYLKILKVALNTYLPATNSKAAPHALRYVFYVFCLRFFGAFQKTLDYTVRSIFF